MSVEVVGDNVLNNDLAIVEIGEPQGVCQGFIRIGRKVRRKKNLFEDCHLRPLLNPGSPGFTLPTARAVPLSRDDAKPSAGVGLSASGVLSLRLCFANLSKMRGGRKK